MNRGQDVITESERIKKLEQRLNEAEEIIGFVSSAPLSSTPLSQ
jgi:hypothetical protein